MSDLISIGLSGLNASQAALSTTSNNITNVSTAGYSREQVITTASPGQSIGAGFIGGGTTLSDVRRIYSSYLDTAVQSSTALNGDASAYQTQVTSTDGLLSNSTTGITAVLSGFFSSLQAASAAPSNTSDRQALLTQAQTLANRFNSVSSQLSDQNTSINSQLGDLASQVNDLAKNIASLNQQIIAASSQSTGAPNALLDARTQAVTSLNALVGATVQDVNGSYNVSIGSGQPLVTGNTTNTLTAQPSASDPSQDSLTLNYGSSSSDVTSVITGGTIGGLLRYRSDVLVPATNSLGRIATVVADAVNTQSAQGVDLNGAFGSNIFSSINSAAAISSRSLAQAGNSTGSGNLDVTIADSSKLTTDDYSVKFTSATAYTVTRSDGTSMGSYDLTTTPAPTIDGFTLALDGGAVAAGDSFKITPTRNGASDITETQTDPNAVALAAPLAATSGSGNSGSGTITQPNLTTQLDIYDTAAQTQLQQAIPNSMPVKLVFNAASGGSQSYNVFDAKGNNIGTGSIVPGQSNAVSITVPELDSTGAAILNTDGTPATFAFSMTVAGSPAANDSYSVGMTGADSTDNRNAQALVTLQTSSTVGGTGAAGPVSMTAAYAALVEQVGGQDNQATIDSTATAAVLATATANQSSVSGVNLDDEAANLVKYQQYYTASSQIIKTAQDIFTTLINDL